MTLSLLAVAIGAFLITPSDARKVSTAITAYCSILAEPLVSYAPCDAAGESIFTVDGPPNAVGSDTSIAIGADGFSVISYRDIGSNALKVAKCRDVACANKKTITILDNSGGGFFTSIAIGTDGFPVISYLLNGGALKVAKCNDAACTGANETITTVDNSGGGGAATSIAIGTDGFPVISYPGVSTVRVAKCNDPACAGADETITTVDDPANEVGPGISIAVSTDGFPVISYQDFTAGNLKVAKCNDSACAGADETITTLDNSPNNVGFQTSIAVGTDGFPVISYSDSTAGALKVAKCNDPACAGGDDTITTADDPAQSVGSYNSIAVGTDGLPVVSYFDSTNAALKVAKCNDPACAGADETITTVDDSSDNVGSHTSIAIGADGFPVVSYFDLTLLRLKVARVSH